MNPFRLAGRRLVLVPGFSLAVVLCLTLGIGANGVVFGAMQGLIRRPLPFADADRLMWVFATPPRDDARAAREKLTSQEATALAGRMTSLSAVGVIGDRSLYVESGGRFVQWQGLWVTPGLFRVLAISPAAGRAFDEGDMQPSGPPAMMLAHERWTQDFAADPGIIGRVLSFSDNKRYTVIGLLPKGLEFPIGRSPQSGNGSGFAAGRQDFWILGQETPAEYPGGTVLARVAPHASPAAAAAEAAAVSSALRSEVPDGNGGRMMELVGLRDQMLGTLAPALPLAQAFAVLVLVVAGANVANLMMARAAGLTRDAAVRMALGGSRRDVMLPLVAEGVLLCTAGAAAGVALAWSVLRWIRADMISRPALSARIESGGTLIVFAAVLCVVTLLVCVAAPIAARSRFSLAVLLHRSDPRQGTQSATRWRHVLVVTQVGLALVLLVGASLLHRSLSRLTSADLGYEPARIVAADVNLYVPIREVQGFYARVMPRLRALPGVEAAGLIQSTPLTGKWTFTDTIGREGSTDAAPQVAGNFVAFDYFEAMRIPVVAGRSFTEAELRMPRPPLVINDVAARAIFGAEHPVGRRVLLGGRPREVIGVVKGTRDVQLDLPSMPQYYEPGLFGDSQILVRVAGDPERFVEALRAELLAADPRLIVRSVRPLDDVVADHLFERRMIGRLLAGFAATAFILAIAGLYGVTQAGASQRRLEFGIRAALGARPADLLRLVMRQALSLALLGIGLGVAAALVLGGVLRSLLVDTSPADPASIAGAVVVLLLVSVAAVLGPARRAARADPVQTLRAL